jgi:hypothetical protein
MSNVKAQQMSSELSAADAKSDHVAKMGEEIGLVYDALWQEVAWIHKKWEEYVALFGTSQGRIELLNEAAPSFFRTVQDSLWEDVLLHLARLTDPPKSMGKSNLSVTRLAQTVSSSPVSPKVNELVTASLRATEFARDWRNRKLAHRDLDMALGQHVEPLAPASRAAVKAALSAIVDVLNAVSTHYLDSTTMFELSADGRDAVALLYVLRDGLRHNEKRQARIKRGEYSPQDLRPEPL